MIVQLRSVGRPNLLEASVSILSKIRHRIIQSPEEVTDVWSLLSTARLDEITRFLDDQEMPIGALEAMVSARNLANTVAHLSDALRLRKSAGIGYTEAERPMTQKLKAVLNEVNLENGRLA